MLSIYALFKDDMDFEKDLCKLAALISFIDLYQVLFMAQKCVNLEHIIPRCKLIIRL